MRLRKIQFKRKNIACKQKLRNGKTVFTFFFFLHFEWRKMSRKSISLSCGSSRCVGAGKLSWFTLVWVARRKNMLEKRKQTIKWCGWVINPCSRNPLPGDFNSPNVNYFISSRLLFSSRWSQLNLCYGETFKSLCRNMNHHFSYCTVRWVDRIKYWRGLDIKESGEVFHVMLIYIQCDVVSFSHVASLAWLDNKLLKSWFPEQREIPSFLWSS